MSARYKNIVPFVVPANSTVIHAHGLVASNGLALKPDRIEPDLVATKLALSADATNITAVNSTNAQISVNVLAEWWHSIERAFGAHGVPNLIPDPFVAGAGGGSSPTGPIDAIAYFDATGALTGNPTVWFVDPVTGNVFLGGAQGGTELFINQTGPDNGSNSGIQQSSLVANRAQYRANQYGANAGIPGMTAFKSRGLTIGSNVAVITGDVLWRATCIGVAGDNASIPIAGLISIIADLVSTNYVATSFELQLVPLAGPINGRKQAFRVDSEGILHIKEAVNTMAGVVTLDGGGQAVVANNRVTATTKFQLTVQDGGAAPVTGAVFQSARVIGTSFTIKGEPGVQVYYQLWEPTVP